MLRFVADVEIDGKPEPRPWKDKETGKERTSYKLNISQNDGADVATIGCDENIYNMVRRRDNAKAYFAYSDGGTNGKPYLKLESLQILSGSTSGDGNNSKPSGVPTK